MPPRADDAASWREPSRAHLIEIIRLLDLSERQKKALEFRWLTRVLFLERQARRHRIWYQSLRMATIIGGIIITALAGLSINSTNVNAGLYRWSIFGLGLFVAIAAAVEEFLRLGERYRHFRRSVELLQAEGWQYIQGVDTYQGKSHAETFHVFAGRIEAIVQQEVETFITKVAVETPAGDNGAGARP